MATVLELATFIADRVDGTPMQAEAEELILKLTGGLEPGERRTSVGSTFESPIPPLATRLSTLSQTSESHWLGPVDVVAERELRAFIHRLGWSKDAPA